METREDLERQIQAAKSEQTRLSDLVDAWIDCSNTQQKRLTIALEALEKIAEDTHSMTLRKPIHKVAVEALAKIRGEL